jgi:GAF domain-containing protein
VVASALRGVLDFDYLSIAWLNRARFHEDRASIVMTDDDGPGERMVENRRRWPIIDGSTRRVLALRRALITPDLQMASVDDQTDGEPWECRLGMRSRLAAPIFDGDDVIGAITVAHRRVATYGESDIRLLAVITDVLSLWLQGRQAAREAERARTVETFIRRLWADDAAGRDDATLLNDAKQLLDVSGLRLYRCDPETMTLEEIAAAGRVGRGVAARRLALSQLPWHRCALDSGRPLHVDQGDPESLMNSSEAQQTLAAGVKTGCVVPITSGGQWLGVLDVLEMRDPDRSCLDRMDQFLLQALAATLAGRWANRFDRGRATGDSRPFPALEVALKELNREIVNPLTSIIGSAELIRHKQPDLRPDTIKYLKTIEQSAARVHESTSGFMMRIDNAIDLRPDRYGWITEKDNTADRRDDNGGRRPVRLTRPVSLLEAAEERTIPAASLSATPDRDTLSEWRPTALTNR